MMKIEICVEHNEKIFTQHENTENIASPAGQIYMQLYCAFYPRGVSLSVVKIVGRSERKMREIETYKAKTGKFSLQHIQ